MTVKKKQLVVLEDSTLTAMALNPVVAKEFPFLASLAKNARSGATAKKGCGSCNRNKEKVLQMAQLKKVVAGLPSDKKRRLKELMNTEKMRVLFKDSAGKPQQLTF